MMEFFRKNPRAAETLRGPMFEDKVVDFILELAKVTDETVTPEELAAEETAGEQRRGCRPMAQSSGRSAAGRSTAAAPVSG